MQLHRRRNPEFEQARLFEYPTHLREAIQDLPNAPGVYIFHEQDSDLPLYIGKSVNLRNRVLSHLRNPDEARMLRQTGRVSHIRTAGEIGALLLEARLIKQQHPLLNQQLRAKRQLCSLRLRGDRLDVVYSSEIDFAAEPQLFGLYASQRGALDALREIADTQRLCYAALGLEKPVAGRSCFRAMLRQCAGVCRGDESPEAHRQRLLGALELIRVACWPYRGAVGLVERFDGERQIHVIRDWCYLGSAKTKAEAAKLKKAAAGFDADGYRILCRPILGGTAELVSL